MEANGKADIVFADFSNDELVLMKNIAINTSISSHLIASPFKVYPNPTRNVVIVELREMAKERLTLRLMNMMGQVLKEQKIYRQQSIRLEMGKHPKGIYVLTLADKAGKVLAVEKIVLEARKR